MPCLCFFCDLAIILKKIFKYIIMQKMEKYQNTKNNCLLTKKNPSAGIGRQDELKLRWL